MKKGAKITTYTIFRFVDNKRMSIIIGCVAGILIFIFIIISIVMNRDVEKDDEPEDEDSMTGSHKSPRPSAKTNRSDSLTCTPNQRNMSRNNSQSSSLLNRISLAEAAGPDALPPRVNRNSTGGPGSASGTLKRGSNTIVNSNSLSRSQQSRDINAQVISIMALDLSKRPRRGRFGGLCLLFLLDVNSFALCIGAQSPTTQTTQKPKVSFLYFWCSKKRGQKRRTHRFSFRG